MQNISEIEELIKLISKLPGLGPKSAKRIVLKLINNRDELVKPMANSLAQVYKNVVRCNSCGALKSNSNGCLNCENTKTIREVELPYAFKLLMQELMSIKIVPKFLLDE